jgi:hypothetical protein
MANPYIDDEAKERDIQTETNDDDEDDEQLTKWLESIKPMLMYLI